LSDVLSCGLEAASILLFIVTSPGIDRRVVNEDAIAASVVLMKHALSDNILPAINNTGHIVAGMKDNKNTHLSSPPTKKRRRSSVGDVGMDAAFVADMKKCYGLVMKAISGTVLLMERLSHLLERVSLDDRHLFTSTAGALVSLEMDPCDSSHQIQVAAINMVTAVFRKYPKMRVSIMEDLFPIMLRMPTAKRSMRSFQIQCSSILFPEGVQKLSQSLLTGASTATATETPKAMQPITALLLSLVQASVVRPTYGLAEDDDEDGVGGTNGQPRLQTGLGGCQAACEIFVKILMNRCSQKGEDGGASDYRPILSNLIDDLLQVVILPEYPAAEMILLSIVNAISRDVQQLVQKTVPKKEKQDTYLNTIFDALGKICAAEARIRNWNKEHPVLELPPAKNGGGLKCFDCYCGKEESDQRYMLSCDRCKTWYHGDCVGISRETTPEKWLCDPCQLERIVDFERDHNTNLGDLGCSPELIDRPYCMRRLLIDYLSFLLNGSGQTGIQDAYGFHLARWLNELDAMKIKTGGNAASPNNNSLISGLLDLWDPTVPDRLGGGSLSGMLQCLTDEGRSRMVVDLVTNLSGLLKSFPGQVGFIVNLLESSSKPVRRLSLKAIEKIADANPKLMVIPKIRNAVIKRFMDTSISVREAVVSLVGSYVVQSPEVANAFHPAFMVGLNDSGLSVRKRTVHVLHEVLCNNPKYEGRAEACSIMLRLAADPKQDDSVRDLIHDLFSKIWLENGDEAVKEARLISPHPQQCESIGDTPASRVSNIEYIGSMETPGASSEGVSMMSNTTYPWTSISKSVRTTARKQRSHHMLIRCEVASEQMIEVVKQANTGEDLTILFRELLSDVPNSDQTKKTAARKKRQGLAKEQIAMLIEQLFEKLLEVEDSTIPNRDKGVDFVAIFRVIKVFTDVSPCGVLKHVDTLLPYLKADNGVLPQHEEEIASSLCQIFSRIIPDLGQQSIARLGEESVADDLVRITKRWGRTATSSAVQALCLLADHDNAPHEAEIFREKMLDLARTFYAYLARHKQADDREQLKKRAKANIKRALGVLGSICQFYSSSTFDEATTSKGIELTLKNLAPSCESMFMNFFREDDEEIMRAALRAMTGIFMAHPREMMRMDESGLIQKVMAPSSPEPVQLESLQCWLDILLLEEARIESGEAKARMESKKNVTVSKRISGDQDSEAVLFGGIIRHKSSRIYEMTHSRNVSIRFAAVDLIGNLLRQGQLNPNTAVPYLLAVQGDVEQSIRSKALKILMLEGEKRVDIVRQRLFAGVKQAYLFQKAVCPDINEVSALITVQKEGGKEKECVFGGVYKECIASVKNQRRGLFRNLLHVFNRDNVKKIDLDLVSFTSQVIAYLPYGFPSDVLYVIYYANQTVALHGDALLDSLASLLRPYGLASEDALDEVNADEDKLEEAAKRHVPHHAKEATSLLEESFDTKEFTKLCTEAGCLILLLRLKTFLMQVYGLNEARCLEFDPQKKNVMEKSIARSSTSAVFESKLPMQGMAMCDGNEYLDAAIFQYAEFRQLMRSDVAASHIEDDDDNVHKSFVEVLDDDDGETAYSAKRRRSSIRN
jgi:cohesin loading factor subunit SCC2